MKQLVLEAVGTVAWHDVPEPDLQGPGDALVRPLAVALCDLDHPMITGSAPIPAPVALGHENVGEVVAVGSAVTSVRPGDLVIVPFQISCGECEHCRRGLTGNCLAVDERAMYGFGALGGEHWGGCLADLQRVPFADAMLVKLPDGVDPVTVASASDNIPDGYRTVVEPLRRHPGADVLVLGGGAPSIALYAVASAVALGAGRVDYVDTDPARLAVASDLGADAIQGEPPYRTEGSYLVTVDGGASRESVACACRSTAAGGTCTSVGIVFEPTTPLPLLEMYGTGMHFHIGRAMARAVIPEVLELVAAGRMAVEKVTSRVVSFADAPTAVLQAETKLVLTR